MIARNIAILLGWIVYPFWKGYRAIIPCRQYITPIEEELIDYELYFHPIENIYLIKIKKGRLTRDIFLDKEVFENDKVVVLTKIAEVVTDIDRDRTSNFTNNT